MKFSEALEPKQEKVAPPIDMAEAALASARGQAKEYEAAMSKLAAEAEQFIVSDEASEKTIVELGAKSAKLVKALEADRLFRVDDATKFTRSVNALYKPLKDVGVRIKKICDQKFTQYRKKLEIEEGKRRRAAEEAHRKLQAKLDKEAKKAKVAPVEVAPVAIPEAPKVTRTETGSASVRKDWTWKEVDFSKVPDEYKVLDTVKLNKVVRAGIRSIPGVEIYEKESASFRTN